MAIMSRLVHLTRPNQAMQPVPVDWEIDGELVKDLVRARLAEVD